MSSIDKIKQLNLSLSPEIVEWRRHLHAHPELSYQEHKTVQYVAEKLKSFGLEPQVGIADTGLVCEIKGKEGGKTTALRADMDALPIHEQNDVPYKSTNEGVMHACGHDVHTSSLLGTASILSKMKAEFTGTVKLIFQPGEEKAPGGASIMIKEGVLENPKPATIIGQHVMPFIPAGKVGFRSGMYMASTDELYMTVKGRGGHGAMPQYNLDPVTCAAQIITALQQVVSRRAHPKTPSVLSIGTLKAEGATNIIPNEVYMEGTFRTMDDEWRERAHAIMKKMATGIAEAMDCTIEFDVIKGYPFLENDPDLTQRTRSFAEEFLGQENVVDLDIWLAAEDFAFYTKEIPGCFYRLGTGNDAEGKSHSVHTPLFDIDETALNHSSGLMAYLALKELAS